MYELLKQYEKLKEWTKDIEASKQREILRAEFNEKNRILLTDLITGIDSEDLAKCPKKEGAFFKIFDCEDYTQLIELWFIQLVFILKGYMTVPRSLLRSFVKVRI